MNRNEWRTLAEQTKTEGGAIVATQMLVSTSLLEPSIQSYIARQAENAARAFYDCDDCEYTYLSSQEYAYDPGPFMYRLHPGDLPAGSALLIGRVRVRRLTSVVE